MSLRFRLSSFFRKRRAFILRSLISELSKKQRRLKILDIGGRVEYWEQLGQSFLRENNVTVTLLNLHKSEFISTKSANDLFDFVIGDARHLNFDDFQFDLAHSNSVVEHLETWINMTAFAEEVRRVGYSYYVQTPYFWFPIDPHFYAFPMFHWLPRPAKARLLRALPLAAAGRIRGVKKSLETVDSTKLLNTQEFRLLFPDAELGFESFCGLPKSMIAIRRGIK